MEAKISSAPTLGEDVRAVMVDVLGAHARATAGETPLVIHGRGGIAPTPSMVGQELGEIPANRDVEFAVGAFARDPNEPLDRMVEAEVATVEAVGFAGVCLETTLSSGFAGAVTRATMRPINARRLAAELIAAAQVCEAAMRKDPSLDDGVAPVPAAKPAEFGGGASSPAARLASAAGEPTTAGEDPNEVML